MHGLRSAHWDRTELVRQISHIASAPDFPSLTTTTTSKAVLPVSFAGGAFLATTIDQIGTRNVTVGFLLVDALPVAYYGSRRNRLQPIKIVENSTSS